MIFPVGLRLGACKQKREDHAQRDGRPEYPWAELAKFRVGAVADDAHQHIADPVAKAGNEQQQTPAAGLRPNTSV